MGARRPEVIDPESTILMAAKSRFPKVFVERLTPSVDGGRCPIKRTIGDVLEVGADVLKDGHDVLGARICFRPPGEPEWRFAPMAYDYDSDRFTGRFTLDRIGRWLYTVEAWADRIATWRRDLRLKIEAGQDVGLELIEGSDLLASAARQAEPALRAPLRQAAAFLRDSARAPAERAARGLSDDLGALGQSTIDRKELSRHETELAVVVDRERARFASWYEMFPRSQSQEPGKHGTFADVERRLPEIADLGFDVVYFPPIHPIGRTNRKGRNNTLVASPGDPGSPWAIGDESGGFTAVHRELGTIEDFDRLVRRAKELGLEVALDYALQCSPDHPWVKQHPDWFFVRPDGSIRYAENPPKKYQDTYPLNLWCEDRARLWQECLEAVRFWIAHGVRTFRVDNPHTKPLALWEWLIGEIHREFPDVIFLSEAFTRPKTMKLLAKLGFNQSYTYFTWRNSASELSEYLTELTATEMAEYYRGNLFANTPDILNEYLQTGGRPAFLVRLVLAATLSPLYGIYSGFELCENVPVRAGSEEYLNSEKYEIRVRDWNAPGNIKTTIARVNRIRRENPALQRYTNLEFHASENDRILFYRKHAPENELLVAVNTNRLGAEATMVHVPLDRMGIGADEPFVVEDLLTGERYTWGGVRNYVRLDPTTGQVAHVLRLVR